MRFRVTCLHKELSDAQANAAVIRRCTCTESAWPNGAGMLELSHLTAAVRLAALTDEIENRDLKENRNGCPKEFDKWIGLRRHGSFVFRGSWRKRGAGPNEL